MRTIKSHRHIWLILFVFLFIQSSFSQKWTVIVLNENGGIIKGAKLLGPLGQEYPVNEKGEAVYEKNWAPDITVKAAGYRTQKINLAKYSFSSAVSVKMQLLPAEYESLNIYVYDKTTKKPVAGASVSVISGQSGATNNVGHAVVGHRQLAGEYIDIIVLAEGYKRYKGNILVGQTQRLEGSIRIPGQSNAVYLEKGANKYNVTGIIVEVLDEGDDKPVSNASVKMTVTDKSEKFVYDGSTNEKGEAKFSDTEVGFEGTTARVIVKHKDYAEKWSDITEDLMSIISPDDRRFLVYVKKKDVDWNGAFTDTYSTFNFSGGSGSVSANWTYTVSDSKGTGSLSSTKVEGNTASGTWKVQHNDDTKTGSRNGTFTITLDGNSITGQLLEDTPTWSYKTGYSAANVQSSMVKGKVWPLNISRKQ